jgi:hypothetical protein
LSLAVPFFLRAPPRAPQNWGISCAQTAIIPTNSEIEASAAASSTNILNMPGPSIDFLEHKKNIVPPLFQKVKGRVVGQFGKMAHKKPLG